MKKIFLPILLVTMMLLVVSCGKKEETNPSTDQKENVENTNDNMKEESENKNEGTDNKSENGESTFESSLIQSFDDQVNKDSKADALAIAQEILKNEKIQFDGVAEEIQEGLLTGFGNNEIKGFTKGAMFAPQISAIAFVGYVFNLPEDADVSAFMNDLKEHANLNWNVCVSADEKVTHANGNTVLFMMYPHDFDQ